MMLSDEPKLCGKVKEEIDKLLRVAEERHLAKSHFGSAEEERQDLDLCRLTEIERGHDYRRIFASIYGWSLRRGHEVYSFLDEFNGYNQIRMHLDDQERKAFVTEWGVFVAVGTMFGLKTAEPLSHRRPYFLTVRNNTKIEKELVLNEGLVL